MMVMIRFGRRKLYIPACAASTLSIGLVRCVLDLDSNRILVSEPDLSFPNLKPNLNLNLL